VIRESGCLPCFLAADGIDRYPIETFAPRLDAREL
jgi:hypothetical protein